MRILKYIGGFLALFGLILSGWTEMQREVSYYFMALNALGGILLVVGIILFLVGLCGKQKGEKQ
ncbi:MAG: hypothetical protein A3G49_00950 [Candidatus Sungbacteria bacterium RIFCSPLOWO2_12_FULL_41_11]|uniref:Uncharacterized protein n=1 Tax=Candidatus Sungbacteria bacterium RIFCSPLOWO2_12_FULL_41_11 TaxID=1802286 RepID=A0A1G2LRQ6_9BACT|nr:MAG: hypothetical protein UV01_C0010G0092 [Parcubacteria group bacterium GW2011_GWA2_42_14]OGZ98455.1 MAG: hypothetical protein A3D41_05120 [Candidatus Sungbacteria bacterium RIFCSPHIGHO2_02_FULL_41_12b]OHA13549.1 MAG: hypothetical protein A3G49_00950 [Candidatus Sungbacteria bacterium RIFCSPLOWO2_12_FULL_41_11]